MATATRPRHLADLPVRTDEIDLLDEAGEQGWELIAIMSNKIAYLRRPIDDAAHVPEQVPPVRRRKTARRDE
jgi:hypothetical protein